MPWGTNPTWQSADPYEGGHLVKATWHSLIWLEQNGYDFDTLGDYDLHVNQAVLGQYRAVIIAGHSEYWSKQMYEGVRDYVAAGGKLVCLSGNTMFWRVSFDGGVMECRKFSDSIGGRPLAKVGELYHEHDGDFRGGLMREAECPAWQVVGVDATVTRIPGFPSVPSDYKPKVLAQCIRSNPQHFDYQGVRLSNEAVTSEVIDWTRAGGGRVFAIGAIGASAALRADQTLSVTYRNALHHLGLMFRLNVSAIDKNGHLKNMQFDGTSWSASWLDMGTSFQTPPTGVMWAPGQLAVTAITTTGTLYYNYFDGQHWSGLSSFGDGFLGRTAGAVVHHVGRYRHWPRQLAHRGRCVGPSQFTLFGTGDDGRIKNKWWDGAAWGPSLTGWSDNLGGTFNGEPAAVTYRGNWIELAAVSSDERLRHRVWNGSTWTDWADLGADFGGSPALFRWM